MPPLPRKLRATVRPVLFVSLLGLPALSVAPALHLPAGPRSAERAPVSRRLSRRPRALLSAAHYRPRRLTGHPVLWPRTVQRVHLRPAHARHARPALRVPAAMGGPPAARAWSIPAVANDVAPVPPTPDALPAPPVLAKAVFLYDVTTGRVLYAWNARASLPMASTTKMMTALLALTYGHLDDWVTASPAAAAIGESTMDLQQGERLRLRDLLYGLLLPSGNDAAIAIAEHIGGSVPAFVALMNRTALALGMTQTHYVNPHGLDAPGHLSSARDLARLALAAMHVPTFRQVVSTRSYTIPASVHNVPHDLININQPLWWYPGTVGIKPGTTGAAGRCAVEWVVRGHRALLLVVLGDVNLVTDVRDLFNWGFGDFSHWYSPLLVPVVHVPEYFGWDSPHAWLALAGSARYYVRTGHTVRAPLLAAYVQGGGLARYGAPTGEEFRAQGVWAQRFAGSWLFYNPHTHKAASHEHEVQ